MTKKEEWLAGTRSAVPIMLGYVPVGIAYGVMARQAGLNTWQTVLMSLTVYGGASEMMAAGMVAQGAAVLTIVLTTFILNLRHIIMSTCVFNQMHGCSPPLPHWALQKMTPAPRIPAWKGSSTSRKLLKLSPTES